MDQLQAKLYKLLEEIDDICKRNGVVYYLAGGTALGAIRGGGFLPWDDDIDLYITRNNWEKLVEVMKTETPENRIFVCNENTDLYWNPVGRYVDKDTTVMMKSQLLCGKACGQLIEFFIMDPMPMGDEAKWEHRRLVKTYTELLSPYFVVNRNILTENTDFDFRFYNRCYRRSRIFGREKVLGELLEKITAVEEKDSDCYCMRWGMRTLMYGKDLLAEPRMERFENAMFPVPAKQEEVARIAYGDSWMYVPEGTGKVVHGLNKDLMTPFQTYVDLYMPLLNKEKLIKNYRKNKRIRAKALYNKNRFKKEFAAARASIAAKYIRENDCDIPELRRLLEQNRLDELKPHLEYYYSQQYHPEIKVNRILVPVDDEYIYIAIMYNVLKGEYYKSNGIMAYRKETEVPLSKELEYADDVLAFCRALSVAVYDKKDVSAVKSILDIRIDLRNKIIDYARAELWCALKEAENRIDYINLVRNAEAKVEKFGEDGELLRFKGMGLYKLNKTEEARNIYASAIENTRNGFVWREAWELFGMDAYDIVDNPNGDEEDDEEELDEE